MTKKSSDFVLIRALRILAIEIESDDGVANACIAEGADRIEELLHELNKYKLMEDDHK